LLSFFVLHRFYQTPAVAFVWIDALGAFVSEDASIGDVSARGANARAMSAIARTNQRIIGSPHVVRFKGLVRPLEHCVL
jgi:hypothetical protein